MWAELWLDPYCALLNTCSYKNKHTRFQIHGFIYSLDLSAPHVQGLFIRYQNDFHSGMSFVLE